MAFLLSLFDAVIFLFDLINFWRFVLCLLAGGIVIYVLIWLFPAGLAEMLSTVVVGLSALGGGIVWEINARNNQKDE